jgi:homocysteine S-methyltransferase
LIREAHAEYFRSGADITITASYQTSIPTLVEGLSVTESQAAKLIASSVELACEARDALDSTKLVAGSIGPYGACLADGSEYTGSYKDSISVPDLAEWHRKRFEIIVDQTAADILAVETIPCMTEV